MQWIKPLSISGVLGLSLIAGCDVGQLYEAEVAYHQEVLNSIKVLEENPHDCAALELVSGWHRLNHEYCKALHRSVLASAHCDYDPMRQNGLGIIAIILGEPEFGMQQIDQSIIWLKTQNNSKLVEHLTQARELWLAHTQRKDYLDLVEVAWSRADSRLFCEEVIKML